MARNNGRAWWVLWVGCALALGCTAAHADEAAKPLVKPNIVWVMAEDIGCDLACYGTPAVQTPVLDRMAAEGVRYTRAYCTSPICSTSRSAMMTGMYQTSIDAHHHRSHRTDGYTLPQPIKPITHYLQDAGYYCAVGCGYGSKTDLNFKTLKSGKPVFNGNDWSKRRPGQPFFAQIQLKVTHRGDWWPRVTAESPDPVDPAKVELPPYLPDHPAIRKDWAMYLDTIEKADAQMGEIFARLKKEGVADHTVVIFIGDNGRCVHRGKGFLFEDGIKVPLIIYWPQQIKSGGVRDELVSMIDVSAQVLAIAGVEAPDHVQGRAFLEPGAEPRRYVFAARDRWDEVIDKSRAVIGERYKYMRNDMPQVPYFTYHSYLERVRPIRPVLWELYKAGKMTPAQAHLMHPNKPREELYDLRADPWETKNLAGDPAHAETLKLLRAELMEWEDRTNDHGRNPETDAARGKKALDRIAHRQAVLAQPDKQ